MRFILLTTFALAIAASPAAGAKPKLHDSVHFAPSWESAVEEAKLLNVPIVVHNHGFFCPPCWGLHSSLLQNKKYIRFAERSTVEVLALSSLQDGIAKDDPRAAEYETEINGQNVKCMVEFPGLTRDQALSLSRSKAATYNQTGGVPYTCVVDPHTLEELQSWRGGGISAKSLIEEIEVHAKALKKAHGDGVSRKGLRKFEEADAESKLEAEKGEFAKAVATLTKGAKHSERWPQSLQERLSEARAQIVRSAAKALDDVEALAESDAKAAKARMGRLRSKIRGTGLEDRLKSMTKALAGKKS